MIWKFKENRVVLELDDVPYPPHSDWRPQSKEILFLLPVLPGETECIPFALIVVFRQIPLTPFQKKKPELRIKIPPKTIIGVYGLAERTPDIEITVSIHPVSIFVGELCKKHVVRLCNAGDDWNVFMPLKERIKPFRKVCFRRVLLVCQENQERFCRIGLPRQRCDFQRNSIKWAIRIALETLAVRWLMRRRKLPKKLISSLRDCCERYRRCKLIRELYVLDLKFHTVIIDNCGAPQLQDILSRRMILLNSFCFSNSLVEIPTLDSIERCYREHSHIIDCIEADDAAGAERAMREHLEQSQGFLTRRLKV